MKRFLIPLLSILALPTTVEANWFGKYGSSQEAYFACQDWKYKNKKRRWCQRDKETNQVLGLFDFTVKKRFKY